MNRFELPPTETGLAVLDPWEPTVFTREEIDQEVARLAALPSDQAGRRHSVFTHARSAPGCPTLAPGIRVTLNVLLPGERSETVRDNATQVEFCLSGTGRAVIGGDSHAFRQWDVWNVPGFRAHRHENAGDEIQVRLTYSNAPLLEQLNVRMSELTSLSEDLPPRSAAEARSADESSPFGRFELDGTGAWLMPYEQLIGPPSVESPSLLWPWESVQEHLDRLESLGRDYRGRRLYLLYNPMTGRTNGTTPSFFATITRRPPGIVDRPHRHVSAAINYIFQGSGHSRIGGRQYRWGPGDLILTAPGWTVHNHASDPDEHVYELTVQDQPFHIANESLLWQEDLKLPPRLLGAEPGFHTNRDRLAAGEPA